MIINSFLSVILPQIAFTYILIYWFLPNYLYKKRNPFVTVLVGTGILNIYIFAASPFKFLTALFNYILDTSKVLPPYNFRVIFPYVLRDQLITLPIVAGFAVMIKLVKRWWLNQKQTEQIASEKARAELQLLKAQIHPHFLFNTLNNIYFFTLSGSPKAAEMINKLNSLLHYILDQCNQTLVPLSKEFKMIRDYMALEKIRYGEEMKLTVEIPEVFPDKMIAPLLLIPFVENSFKHGASKMIAHPWVKLRITIENNFMIFFVVNSRPTLSEPGQVKGKIGLKNVKKRLQLLYPSAHELNIVSEPENFIVSLKLQLRDTSFASVDNKEIKSGTIYATA
jgi:sensor histidine kinase YesM